MRPPLSSQANDRASCRSAFPSYVTPFIGRNERSLSLRPCWGLRHSALGCRTHGELGQTDATDLFIDRAAVLAASCAFTPANAEMINRICRGHTQAEGVLRQTALPGLGTGADQYHAMNYCSLAASASIHRRGRTASL
jgi:hypothetical protein